MSTTSLIDMGGRNRLLNFRHTQKATVELTLPPATELLKGLTRGWGFAPIAEDDETDGEAHRDVHPSKELTGRGLVTQKTTQRALDSSLYEAWGVARAGSRIRDNVRAVADALARSGTVSLDGTFHEMAERTELKARRPEAGEKPRTVIQIAPAERRLALYALAAECPGMSEEELIKQTCQFFGCKRMGRDIRDCLEADIAELHRRGALRGGPPHISAVPAQAGVRDPA
ncbi:DUF4011 domain-containing protein [Streptomyces sp. WMMC897]|uniref:DUF4011 domain-containing protein n=1 Tax=Streptomyces sp. WMMC897 TaxID=3014782 RepID=UPI0022B6D524|nr:DUF4011 domain-containing protein [Streptomyces sp. WMMC897]MCZ7416826.1 DUF4011 domain-containing protein [Streptomyces sp. WMMC897]